MKYFSILFIFLISLSAIAQSKKDKVLFTIDGEPTYVSEFSRVYHKNLDVIDEKDQKGIKEYFDLFVEYKLKLTEARSLKLHEKEKYKKELAGYRRQLAKNYLTDANATSRLVKEAYNRMKKEIKASHILIKVDENASPEDSLKAYNKIMKLRKEILAGADFGTVAVENSDDPSAKGNKARAGNKGNLGYFSAFRMVYPFENAAFNTPLGEVSMPIRTQFGYHIVKVNDIRENKGEVTVAHILLMTNKEKGNNKDQEQKIKDLYTKLQNGENFEKLAKRFSEDRSSAVKGGKLPKFGPGRIRSVAFEDVSFSLENPNDISKPFQSEFGWHIVKLIQKHQLKSFEEEKSGIERKVKSDRRSKLINSSLLKKIRKSYNINENGKAKNDIVNSIHKDFFQKQWEKPKNTELLSKVLFQIEDQKVTVETFLNHLMKNKQRIRNSKNINPKNFVNHQYKEFLNAKLLNYYEEDLVNINDNFAAVYEEYRDGLLLFDLMENEIWEKAKKDTLGLQDFFQKNTDNYKWKERGNVIVASCTNKNMATKVKELLRQGKSMDDIKKLLNKNAKVNVIFSSGLVEEGHRSLPKKYHFKEGVSDVIEEGKNDYAVVKVVEIVPESHKKISEVKGKVISDYQTYLEQKWMKNLKEKYTVKVKKRMYRKLEKLLK